MTMAAVALTTVEGEAAEAATTKEVDAPVTIAAGAVVVARMMVAAAVVEMIPVETTIAAATGPMMAVAAEGAEAMTKRDPEREMMDGTAAAQMMLLGLRDRLETEHGISIKPGHAPEGPITSSKCEEFAGEAWMTQAPRMTTVVA
jgi:hypothetical protein